MVGETAYIDTSILGAYYCPESLSSAAETMLRGIGTTVISVLSEVDFFDFEVTPAGRIEGASGANNP